MPVTAIVIRTFRQVREKVNILIRGCATFFVSVKSQAGLMLCCGDTFLNAGGLACLPSKEKLPRLHLLITSTWAGMHD
jgi:hypothetical protein